MIFELCEQTDRQTDLLITILRNNGFLCVGVPGRLIVHWFSVFANQRCSENFEGVIFAPADITASTVVQAVV